MVYSTEAARWKAYQFSDPFSSGSFYVCNKTNHYFCRPDCDARQVTNLRSEIIFVDTSEEALRLGYTPCEACSPMRLPHTDVKMLINCVSHVNSQIGFLSPLMDENEDLNNRKIKENILETMRARGDSMSSGEISGNRRASAPVVGYNGNNSRDYDSHTLSKNDSDHYRLVDLACRHLAFAAANNVSPTSYSPNEASSPTSPDLQGSSSSSCKRKRKRRGGILGFKELAAKSKLSPWHFHRVFKSVTGLTPKNYGDRCYEYLKASKADKPDLHGGRPLSKDLHSSISRKSSRKRLISGYIPSEELSPRKRTKSLVSEESYGLFDRTRSGQSMEEAGVPATYSTLSFPDLSKSYDYSSYDDDSLTSSSMNQRLHASSEGADMPNSSLQMFSQDFNLELSPVQTQIHQTYSLTSYPSGSSYYFNKSLSSLNYRNSLVGHSAATQRVGDYNLTLYNNSQHELTNGSGLERPANNAGSSFSSSTSASHSGEEIQLQGFVDPFNNYYGANNTNQFNYSYNNGLIAPYSIANPGTGPQATSGTLLALGSSGSSEPPNIVSTNPGNNGEDMYKTGSDNLQFELLHGYSNI